MEDLISVIIPMFNDEKTIKRCLESVINQSYSNLEIIIINDGSFDKSESIVKEMAKKDARIKIYSQKNSGVSIARNTGLKKANGKFVTFVDSDDYIYPNMYSSMHSYIEDNDVCVCNFIYKYDEKIINNKSYKNIKKMNANEFVNNMHYGAKYFGFLWNKLYKRDLFYKNFFDSSISYYEDEIFNINITKKNGFKACYINQFLYNYYQRIDSKTNSKNKQNIMDLLNGLKKVIEIENENQYSLINFHIATFINIYSYYYYLIKDVEDFRSIFLEISKKLHFSLKSKVELKAFLIRNNFVLYQKYLKYSKKIIIK